MECTAAAVAGGLLVTGSPYLAVTAERQGDRLVLTLRGELDVSNREDLRRAVSDAVQDGTWQSLTLDLSSLDFADCAGLSVMVQAHQQLAGQGRRLVLADAQPAVRRLLTLVHLSTYLDLRPPQSGPRQRAAARDQVPYPVLPSPRCGSAC
jgi:anti-sigma B factor antagonist